MVIVAGLPMANAVIPTPGCVETFHMETFATLYSAGGLWGFANDDIYIGAFDTTNAHIKHWDGNSFTTVLATLAGNFASRQIFGFDNTHVMAVGGGSTTGGSYFYDGISWIEKNLRLGVGGTVFQDVHGSANDNIWAVAFGGGSSTNARVRSWDGVSWTAIDVGNSIDLHRAMVISPTSVFITGINGYVGKFNGISWADISIPGETLAITGIWGDSETDVWVAATNTKFYNWDGDSWSAPYSITTAFRTHGTSAERIFSVSGNKIAQWKPESDLWSIVADHTGDMISGAGVGYDRVWVSETRVMAQVRGSNSPTFTNGFEEFNCYPISNAGANIQAQNGETVTLSGCQSNDPDHSVITYSWVQTQGPAVTLDNNAICNPSYIQPTYQIGDEPIIFELTVSDGDLEGTDAVSINTCINTVNSNMGLMLGAVGALVLILLLAVMVMLFGDKSNAQN